MIYVYKNLRDLSKPASSERPAAGFIKLAGPLESVQPQVLNELV